MKHICTELHSPVFRDTHKATSNSELVSHDMKDKSRSYTEYALFLFFFFQKEVMIKFYKMILK